MPPFKPRLTTVGRLREKALDAARQRLAEATRAEGVLAEQRRAAEDELDSAIQGRRKRLLAEGCDVSALLASQRYEAAIHARMAALAKNSDAVSKEIANRQQAVAEARRGVRVIELLNERAKERHELQETREENRSLDEIAARRYREQTIDPH